MEKDLHKKLHIKRDKIPKYQIGKNSQSSISKNQPSKNKIFKFNKKFLTFVGLSILVLGTVNLIEIPNRINLSQDVVANNESIVMSPKNTTSTTILTTTRTTSTSSSTTTSSTTTTLYLLISSTEEAQSKLQKLGLYDGDIDGDYDAQTKSSIKQFQKLSGLVVDGILGPLTKEALSKTDESNFDIGGADIDIINELKFSQEIEDAQKILLNLGLYKGEVDGINGTNTKVAIKEFQKKSGLIIDGILGPNTLSALSKGSDAYITPDKNSNANDSNVPVVQSETMSTSNLTVDLRDYNPNATCIDGYVNDAQIWVPDPCFYPVFVFRYGQTAQVNSQSELEAYLNQNWSLTQEKTYSSLGRVPTQNYTDGINSPINGLIMPSGSNNSIVIGIKNDNNVNARPQSGPQNADAVVEVLVEGGMTRFINIFYQSDTSYHGPIRSARPTDPTVLRPVGGVLVASGATGGLIPEIVDMGVPVITDRRPDYFRISSRRAPHNLYADTNLLKSTAISKGYKKFDNPQPLFPWGDPSYNNWKSNTFLTLPFSGLTETTWTWNGSSYVRTYYDAYKNKTKDNIHYWTDSSGNTGQISFKTIIALFCEPYVHPLQLPSVKTVGEGRAIILHGGKMLDAKWKRGSNLDPFHIVDSNNNILYVPKGKVWISLVPNTKNPSFG
jgi:peptidoglycan hydrolase-like protein with peptidoglycan-binding domain